MVKSSFHTKEHQINIGIDLGTTNSAVAVHQDGHAEVCKIEERDVLPSAIFLWKRGEPIFGEEAYRKLPAHPRNVATAFKRELGTSWKFEFKDTQKIMTAEECSAEILKELVANVRLKHQHMDVDGAVITVPAAFTQPKREATMRAADKAGLSKIHILEEPIAASMAVTEASGNNDTKFLVYDIGGGTLDLAIVSNVRGNIAVIGHKGVEMFGGRDFDRKITDDIVCPWLMENFALPNNFQATEKFLPFIRKLWLASEDAKKKLSTNSKATISALEDNLRMVDGRGEDIYVEVQITRSDYEKIISEKLIESVALANKLLMEQGYSNQNMDKIVFIGGPTKYPYLRDFISNELGIPVDVSVVDPMTAVAKGAAIFCESREWKSTTHSSRKQTRTKEKIKGEVEMDIEYPLRVLDKQAKVKLQPTDETVQKNLMVQITTEEDWTSSLKVLESGLSIDIPVEKIGDNKYRIIVVDANRHPVDTSIKPIVITRVVASVSAISAPHTVAVRVVNDDDKDAEATLQTIIEKGTNLPAKGEVEVRSAKDIASESEASQLSIELFEQPDTNNKTIGEPNVFIGSCVIRSEDLEGGAIYKEDIVKILWAQDESGLVRAEVEIPHLGKKFNARNFYTAKLADNRRFFEGEAGKNAVFTAANDAQEEINQTIYVVEKTQLEAVYLLENKLTVQLATSSSHSDSESLQEAYNKIREIRQQLFAIRNDPKNLALSMRKKLEDVEEAFGRIRDGVDESVARRFDGLAKIARDAIRKEDSDAKKMLKELQVIYFRELNSRPEMLYGLFNAMVQMRSKAIDREEFDRHVSEGERAINSHDINQLRSVIGRMRSNIEISGDPWGEQEQKLAADIMKK